MCYHNVIFSCLVALKSTRVKRIYTLYGRAIVGFLGSLDCKASAYNVGDPDSIPGLGRSPGEGNGNPFQYFCTENSMDREVWGATVHGDHKESERNEQLTLSPGYNHVDFRKT